MGSIPIPESSTRITALSASRSTMTRIFPPGSVYFAALVSRFVEYLLEAGRIGVDPDVLEGRLDLDLVPALAQERLDRLHGGAHDGTRVDPVAPQAHFSLAQPRHVEQVLQEPRHVPDLALRDRQSARRGIGRHLRPLEDMERAADRRERVAQLVREYRHELVLLAVRLLERLDLSPHRQVSRDLGETEETAVLRVQRGDDHVRPEAAAVLADSPPLVFDAAMLDCRAEHPIGLAG